MRRIFGAFLWIRWRVFINSLERRPAARHARALLRRHRKLGPIMALVLLIPSASACSSLASRPGSASACRSWLMPVALVRYFLLFATALTIFGPIVLPSRDGGNVVRLLLLPIPRLSLYMAQMAGALADPWIAAHDAGARRRAAWRRHRRPSDHRGAHAGRRPGVPAAGRRPDVAHLVGHPPAAARPTARRPRHALRRADPSVDRAAAGDARQRSRVPRAGSTAGASGARGRRRPFWSVPRTGRFV